MTYVRDLAEIRPADDETVGGKGADLGELLVAGVARFRQRDVAG